MVRRSRIQGRGVFATRTIRKGTRVAEYTGERITSEEAYRRYDDEAMERHHTFLFDLDGDACIDGAVGGNWSRFINHSCDPNCESVQEGDRVFVYALRTVREGEELTYDYRYIVEGPIDEATRKMYACRCGSATCRGTILRPELLGRGSKRGRRKTAPS
jgi:SET domain-containing protein